MTAALDACTCAPQWPGLTVTIDGQTRTAVPAADHSAAESATTDTAHCTGCGAPWPAHWTLAPIEDPEKVAAEKAPVTAVDLLRLLVAERPNGEVRPQQERLVEAVEAAIKKQRHLVGQAGTGTGKTLGYLIPAIAAGERVVVSTATKQLGEQIVNEDLPTLANLMPKIGGPRFTYALLKGRQNYLCHKEVDSLINLGEEDEAANGAIQDALFEDPAPAAAKRPTKQDLSDLNALLKWAETTDTGDRSDAPAVSDKAWNQVSTDSAGCPGAKACPFGQQCFSERSRWAARDADVVVTNHAMVANDLESEMPLLGEYDVLVMDEVHELESYLSSAWGVEVSASGIKHQVALAARKVGRDQAGDDAKALAVKVGEDLDALDEMLTHEEPGLKPELPEPVVNLLVTIAHKLVEIARALDHASEAKNASAQIAADRKGAAGKVGEAANSVMTILQAGDSAVRWLEGARDRRGPVLKSAPLWVGQRLMDAVGSKTLIATSATIIVGGTFDAMVRTLGLGLAPTGSSGPARGFDTLDVGTPFDYDKQAVLYIPDARTFPEPVWKNKDAHKQAVLDDLVGLVSAAGGRTLALFTTTKAAKDAAVYLRERINTPVLAQGDAPAQQLIDQFADDEATTLCATRGMWHGVNVPGPSLSLVVMDAIPFTPHTDPLTSARSKAADEAGRSGFAEVLVAGAAIALAQGAGRLVRTATDKGVVAVLDPRLFTKGYGRTLLASLPPMRVFRERGIIESALTRLTGGPANPGTAKSTARTASAATVTPAPKPVPRPRKAAPRRAATRGLARQVKGKKQADETA